jgi:hypothetical protein
VPFGCSGSKRNRKDKTHPIHYDERAEEPFQLVVGEAEGVLVVDRSLEVSRAIMDTGRETPEQAG